jgi:hypothetical protein
LTDYRAYTVGPDGHFMSFEPMACDDDAEAIQKTKRLMDGHRIELWSGARFIARLGHHDITNNERHYSKAELIYLRRTLLRAARALPVGPERNEKRQTASSLRALFRNQEWLDKYLICDPPKSAARWRQGGSHGED